MHPISEASTPKIPVQEPELAPEHEPSPRIPLYELVSGPSCFRRYTYELVTAPYDLTKPAWSASRPKPILIDLVGEAAQVPCIAASAAPSLSSGRAPPGSNRIVSHEYVRVPSISNIPLFEYVRAPTTTTHRPAVGQVQASANSKRATMEPAYAPTTSRRQAYESVNVQAPSTSRSNVVYPTNEPSSTQRRIQITIPAHKADPITGERSVVHRSALGQRCKQCGKRSILNFAQCFHNDRAFARVHRLQCMHVSSSVRRRSNHPRTVQVGSLQYSDISSSEGPDLGVSEDEAPVREIETHEISDSDDE